GPAKRSERHQRRGKPGVEHVVVALERAAIAFGGSLFFGLVFAAADVDIASIVVPGRNLMAPPQLARDAPVLDVLQPLVIGRRPVLRKKLHVPLRDRDKPALDESIHLYEPLIG